MQLLSEIALDNIEIQRLNISSLVNIDVLRLDKIHPVVSGNKWFKLKYYLLHALNKGVKTIATFGGAYSNHLLATAYACNFYNIPCIGFVRGEQPAVFSDTLNDVQQLNMQLQFVSREDYHHKADIMLANKHLFFIPEGGYGLDGVLGAAEMLQTVKNASGYDYIICAVGTGTMLAGLIQSVAQQQCIGISVLKNNIQLTDDVCQLLPIHLHQKVNIMHQYHFGGYAKHNNQLLSFMKKVKIDYNLPLDFVYTAKAFYGMMDLFENNYFPAGSNILFIHSGGLQGNRSLQQTLIIA